MIGKIIGAVAGAQAAKYSHKMGGTSGAVMGALAVPLLRRIRIPYLLAMAAGGYAVKKLNDKAAEPATPLSTAEEPGMPPKPAAPKTSAAAGS